MPVAQVCGAAKKGYASCLSLRRTGLKAHKGLFTATAGSKAPRSPAPAAAASAAGHAPAGYGPADLQSAYKLPSGSAGRGQTVAIVDAYDDPKAESDLAVYRQQYGLPACTTANGCFEKVNQEGQQSNYPPPDVAGSDGWEEEESLDVDMVSASCPLCRILLVEADSPANADLFAAEDEAVALGARYVSNSWGECEYSGEQQDDKNFNHPGVAIIAAGGDNGYDDQLVGCSVPNYPAASPYVTSVGGTNLQQDSSVPRGWTESTWGGLLADSTGSGCSASETKPSWQTDTGCANRADNDVSAVADPATGVAAYDSYLNARSAGWQVFGGTSVATPIIASTYALAGAPQTGTNPASYPYLHNSGLNDITDGSDSLLGCSPSYLCTAGPGYDGPTGLGTPDGVSAFEPVSAGTVTGTVTGAGNPLPGAAVSVGSYQTTTSSTGGYSLTVAAGTYDLTVQAFGYASKTMTGVAVTAGRTTTQNLTLATAGNVTVSGDITDGSGHGWPLYAKITAGGTSVTAYSSPYTGKYSLTLPGQAAYALHVAPVYPGYTAKDVTVSVGTSNVSQNIKVNIDASTCVAPGYGYPGTFETFDRFSGTTAEDGWTVTNSAPGTAWAFNNPDGLGNDTGDTGSFATADEQFSSSAQDTSLVSPVTDLSDVTSPVISFDTAYFSTPAVKADVDLSLDSGQSWQNVWQQAGPGLDAGRLPVSIAIPQAAGKPDVQVRFHFTAPDGQAVWQVDDVLIGSASCQLTPGGLAAGVITNANTGGPVNGATVTTPANPAEPWPSAATGDPAVAGGFYWLFSPHTGANTVTAAHANYQSASAVVSVAADAVTHKDWVLNTGSLTITPASVSATQTLGQSASRQLTLTNNGTAPVTVSLGTQDGGFAALGQHPATRGAPLRLVRAKLTSAGFVPASSASAASTPAGSTPTTAGSGLAWSDIAPYPTQIAGNAMATDPATGDVYSVGGANGVWSSNGFPGSASVSTAAGYVYTPSDNTWSPITPAPQALVGASAAFVNGSMYVIGGLTAAGTPSGAVYVYHPGPDTWTQDASMPQPAQSGASAVLAGQIYVVGGCAISGDTQAYECEFSGAPPLNSVYRFNPGSNTWTQLADYPIPVDLEACAGIDGQVVCAGGYKGASSSTYLYDPVTNTWSKGADMPAGDEEMAYAGANGKLQITGGITDGPAFTNQAWQYDPVTRTWSSLPNDPNADFIYSGSCGFYTVGGLEGFGFAGQQAEVLPGLDQCGSTGGSPWLSASQSAMSLAPGQTANVTLTLNSAKVNQPGTYTATVWAATNSASPVQMTNVTMHVNAPAGWGAAKGTVTDTSGHPIFGATIAFGGSPTKASATGHQAASSGTVAVSTDANGSYQWWLPGTDAPLQVSAAKDGYQPQVKLDPGWPKSAAPVRFTLKADPGSPAYALSSAQPPTSPSSTNNSASAAGHSGSAVTITAASVKSQLEKAAQKVVGAPEPKPALTTMTPAGCNKTPAKGHAQCFAMFLTPSNHVITPDSAGPPASALTPSDLQDAYKLPVSQGAGQTVATVIWGDDPDAESDLAVFRSQFGLPPCTTANGCFRKVNQTGDQGNYPVNDTSTAEETSLDLDAISASCPLCNILLVEANDTAATSDLDVAEDTAVSLGAKFISNSWGAGDTGDPGGDDTHFDHPGVAIVASGGDNANVVDWPSAIPTVTSVGGTRLVKDPSVARGWDEEVCQWNISTCSPEPVQGTRDDTGSGCSSVEPKPAWQDDIPGLDAVCPNNRATTDISADADPLSGLAVYDSDGGEGWFQVGGTSLSSPLVAGMYALAGPPVPGTYPVTYPYDAAAHSHLFDITDGQPNGSCGNLLCTPGPGWDGPTGWGSPDGVDALATGPHGDIAGHVTDAATGDPLAGVTVSTPEGYTATTDSSGAYDLHVATGSYTVTAAKFGYTSSTQTGVQVSEDQTTTQDFALTAAANVTVSGRVTDGTGHNWPLYSKITISGVPVGPIYTDPYTGQYSVTLPGQASYTVHVAPVYPGYTPADQTVQVGTSDVQHNIKVSADPSTCAAPGYGYHLNGIYEQFTGWAAPGGTSTTPQDGWTISTSTAHGWEFVSYGNSAANDAGGTGAAAIVGPAIHDGRAEDSTLESPAIDLSGNSSPQLSFDQESITGTDSEVDLSLNGGQTWQNVWQGNGLLTGGNVTIPLPQAAGHSGVRVRFHFAGTGFSAFAVDDVLVGTRPCQPTAGGLAAGVVTDANTGSPVNGAAVSATGSEQSAATAATDDPAVPGGFYWLFSPHTGSTTFTATDGGYQAATASVNIAADAVARQDLVLKAGRLTVSTGNLSATKALGQSATGKVTYTNTGTAPVHVTIGTQDGELTPAGLPAAGAQTSPRHAAAGHSIPGALPASAVKQHPVSQAAAGSGWTNIAAYPDQVAANAVAYDPQTGDLYSVGGTTGDLGSTMTTAQGYVYQPSTKKWSAIAPAPQALSSSAAAFVGGTIYLIGGFDSNNDPTAAVYAYNPGGNWSQVASLPRPVGGAAAAVLGGQLYVIGGDLGNLQPTDSVERYDPAANTWTQLASYPKAMEGAACGGVDGELVCAGGQISEFAALNSTFVYDPASNTWTQAADMPYRGYAMGYSTANGQLQVVGGENWDGVQGTSTLLSNVSEYNPATNSWAALPSLPTPAALIGAGCGLYAVGGGTGLDGSGGASSAETLGGYASQCDGVGAPPWLSPGRTGFDLAAGQSVTVTVTLNSAEVTQPGTFTGSVFAEASTPYLVKPVQVSMQVTPPATWSLIQGTVKDAGGQPVPGATVQIGTKCTGPGQCAGTAYTVKTDSSGYYQWWLDAKDSTLQVIAAKDGNVQQVAPATAAAGQAVAVNYALQAYVPIMPWSTTS